MDGVSAAGAGLLLRTNTTQVSCCGCIHSARLVCVQYTFVIGIQLPATAGACLCAEVAAATLSGMTHCAAASIIVGESARHCPKVINFCHKLPITSLWLVCVLVLRACCSFVEVRDTSLVWNYKHADVEFGRLQARDLLQVR